ncbi:MAG: histidine phosphatase family protein [Sulfuricella sp.]
MKSTTIDLIRHGEPVGGRRYRGRTDDPLSEKGWNQMWTAVGDFRAGVAELKRRYAGRQPVRVFYEIWHEPLITVNGEHLTSDVIMLCGGRNIFAGVRQETPAAGP